MQRAIILAAAISLAAAPASAAERHLTLSQARSAIERSVGPGTATTRCKRFDSWIIGCDYRTTATNGPIYNEEPGNPGTWESYATAWLTRRGVLVTPDTALWEPA